VVEEHGAEIVIVKSTDRKITWWTPPIAISLCLVLGMPPWDCT
jgi:hypothetical protein